MIHNGNKVLDGTVGEIQRQFPADEVKIRLAEGQRVPSSMRGVKSIEDRGAFHHIKLDDGSLADALLKQLANESRLEHFELLRPSLHNIFIRIAGSTADSAPKPSEQVS